MLGPALILLLVAVALEAHLRARSPNGAAIRWSLVAFAAGHLMALLALAAVGSARFAPFTTPLLVAALLGGFLSWAGLSRLVACDSGLGDWIWRGLMALGALATSGTGWGTPAFFGAVGFLSYRWNRRFTTRQLFLLALAAAALFAIDFALEIPRSMEGAQSVRLVFNVARWAMSMGSIYVSFGVVALLYAFVRDPSLGIRTVGRRLALSHVLAVLIPLLLIGGVWAVATVLGVNNDRALVAARAVAAEGADLHRELGEVLAAPGDARSAARARIAAHGGAWHGARLWLVERERFTRLAGDSLPGEVALRSWTDSLASHPTSGFVLLGDSLAYGAAARDPGDSSRAAIALLHPDSLLAGDAARVSGARLTVVTSTVGGGNGSLVIGGSGTEEIRSQRVALSDSLVQLSRSRSGGRWSREDSLEVERVRQMTRGLGIGNVPRRSNRPGRNVSLTTPRDTFNLVRATPGALLLGGKALVPGISWNAGQKAWSNTRTLLLAEVPARRALTGMFESVRENPITWLPIVLILSVAVLAILVAAFDFAMVRGMAGSITATIDALKRGAARLEAGQLDQRIEVRGDDDLWSVAGTFNRAMVGLERARVLETERARIESELATARRIQARLLPDRPPRVTGFEIAGLSESAREVGGDYFDHIPIGDQAVLLVIADVSGKGVPAALLMSDFRASLIHRDLAKRDPVALATQLNEAVVRSVETGKFVTAFLAFADAREGRLDYVSAGHNPAVLRRGDGSHELLNEGGLPFGVMSGARYASGRSDFRPGDLLALYTDGVTEGADAAGQLWGEERLLETLGREHDAPCDRLARLIADRVRAFEGESGPADDITLLLARRVPFC